jgi:hypothetical protein
MRPPRESPPPTPPDNTVIFAIPYGTVQCTVSMYRGGTLGMYIGKYSRHVPTYIRHIQYTVPLGFGSSLFFLFQLSIAYVGTN